MPKSSNQKLKLLVLSRYLLRQSDENHPVTIPQMIEELSRYEIKAERKSLYDDLEALRTFGLDVVGQKGKNGGYFIASRDFEMPELKLLVDSIQSSKFITQKKTRELIGKVEALASVYDAALLERQVYVRNRVKSMNESVYYNVDAVSGAISADRSIRFRYFEFTVEKEKRFRRNGAWYVVSPYALLWDDENYYLLAWDDAEQRMKHYRVDKMSGIQLTGEARRGKEAFEQVDMSAYSQKVFGMFAGQVQKVRLRFLNHLAGAVLDRFGKDAMLIRDGEEHFTVTVEAVVSPQFFAWVFGFGPEAEILSPESVRREAYATARRIAELYE